MDIIAQKKNKYHLVQEILTNEKVEILVDTRIKRL